MAEITAAAVKALREETGLGMMECKKALTEANGDVEIARIELRKKGAQVQAAKASRTTKEGLVGIKVSADRKTGAMVEVRCETDFCARNDEFVGMVTAVLDLAYDAPTGHVEASPAMTERLQATLAKIGENMSYGRGVKIQADKIGSYLHHNNKVGVMVGIVGELSDEIVQDICMHVAFADPMGITPEDIPADVVENEKKIAVEQAMESGKPKDIAEKMVAGKIRKFLEERALTEQLIAREDKYGKKQVKELLGAAKITAFARFAI
ncbi:MAG: translation elongation factor Ts [Phycisphaerae bacterium]|nr:translation elongation factor Ts [Phycisphaerae bacterium]